MYIVLTIFSSWWLFFVFKFSERYNISQFQTIIFNYIVCASLSFIFSLDKIDYMTTSSPWFWNAIILGIFFIILFNLMAYSTIKVGISATTVSTKLSLVIPVIMGLLLLNDTFTIFKIIGFLLAFLSIYLITKANATKLEVSSKKYYIIPIILFVWNGVNDAIISYTKAIYLNENTNELFVFIIFFTACVLGIFYFIYKLYVGQEKLHYKNILAGVVLGIPNYFSIYFLLKSLDNNHFTNSEVYTLINIGIVLIGVSSGYLLFKEKLSFFQLIGVVIAIFSIYLITLA